jgi:hypothetical protein
VSGRQPLLVRDGELTREIRRCLHKPWDVPLLVLLNGLLVCGGWFLLSRADKASLFSLHGPMAFPIVLESWMFADVAATNVLGGDAPGALAAMSDPVRLRQFLDAKRIVLWLLVAPLCSVLALLIGIERHSYLAALSLAVGLLVTPAGVLVISTCAGALWPYHPRSLRWRLANRWNVGKTVRWLILLVGPYSFVPAITTVLLVPAGLVIRHARHGVAGPLRSEHLAAGTAIACVTSLLVAVFLHDVTARLVERRASKLQAYLSDPDRG